MVVTKNQKMHYSQIEIESLEKIYRANLINAISGYKPANLIGTISKSGNTNLAIFSSVIHLGANPALLGLIVRPAKVPRHSYENMKETGFFTINHIHKSFVEKAHFTSAKFDRTESEFDACKLTPEFEDGFLAPFVKESDIKIGLRLVDEIPISLNETILMIGKIEHIYFPSEIINQSGNLDLEKAQTIAVSGLESYYLPSKLASFPYAKVDNLPSFG